MVEKSVTLQPSESKVVSFETTPSEAGTYQVSVDGLSGSFSAKPEVELITFTLEIFNIPGYASVVNEWYVQYAGKYFGAGADWGSHTPLDSPIVLENVPATGEVLVTITGGPFDTWQFRVTRTFRDSETYRFNLEAGFIEGPGIAVRDLVIEPDYLTVGEEASISVTAVNSGVSEESHEVLFSLQKYEDSTLVGSPITQRGTVTLASGESKLVTIKVTPEAGRYLVSVEGLTGWIEAVAPYPYIASPKIESLEWVAGGTKTTYTQSGGGLYPGFRGVILLPAPGKDQYYIFQGSLGDTTYLGWTGIDTYLGDGRWELKGTTVLPFRNYPYEFVCYWEDYFKYIGVEPPGWVESNPTYYSRIPCMGVVLGLSLTVELWERYVSGIYTTARKVKGWSLNTELTLEVDTRM